MKAHKGNVFGLLFFCYFGIYAVLPLVCTLSSAGVAERVMTSSEMPSLTARFPKFQPHHIRSRFLPGKGGANVTFPMSKERAILPDDSLTHLLSPGAVSLSLDDLLFFPAQPQWRKYIAGPDRGDRVHHCLYLSHSPPRA